MTSDIDNLAETLNNHMVSVYGDIGVCKNDFVDYFSKIGNEKLVEFGKMVFGESSLTVEKLYDKIASTYDNTFSKRHHIDESFNLIDKNFRGKIGLDLGCGTGRSTKPLLKYCDKAIGIDISKGMIEEARRQIPSSDITFFQGGFLDAGDYGFQADLLVCVGVTRYIPIGKEIAFMQYLDKVMAPGAIAVLTFVARVEESLESKIDMVVESLLNRHGVSDRRFDLSQIEMMASYGPFKQEKIIDMESPFLYQKKIVRISKNV